MQLNPRIVIYIMGVSGTGKSTIGSLLSAKTGIPFYDGDDFHSNHNKTKMADGKPLNDEDRTDWLIAIHTHVKKQLEKESCIVACSALKESYRSLLSNQIEKQTRWVFLQGSFEVVSKRLKERTGHFMPSSLLQSQFETLEIPTNRLTINIENTPETILEMIKDEVFNQSEFGIIGLGVMGKSLCRNFASKDIPIAMYNRHATGIEESVALNFKNEHKELTTAKAFDKLEPFVNALQQPRKILLMVKAGPIIDSILDELTLLLSENDIVIDGGNSHYKDTEARIEKLSEKGIHFIGCGISGGEEGALKGPSLMPGGNQRAYLQIASYLNTIAAKDINNKPCCAYIGEGGSGHFVKTIHNGIEYVEMQLLAEVYHLYKHMGKTTAEIAGIFTTWKSSVNSFLLEITITILQKLENDEPLLDKILDKAGNKGTGNWATIASAELVIPSTLIASSLFARYISTFKEERVELSKLYNKQKHQFMLNDDAILKAYTAARLLNHHQGFKLIKEASTAFNYDLNLSEISRIWTNGCIIRSDLMTDLVNILKKEENTLKYKTIINSLSIHKNNLTKVVVTSLENELAIPCFSDALNYFNGVTTASSPANLIQAQRDFFGAHTYQRTDDDSDNYYHTNWT